MTDHNQTREAWNATAKIWDEKMGDEGNDFHQYLVRPAIEKLLQIKSGQNILDVVKTAFRSRSGYRYLDNFYYINPNLAKQYINLQTKN